MFSRPFGRSKRTKPSLRIFAMVITAALISTGSSSCDPGSSTGPSGAPFLRTGVASTIDSMNPMVAFQENAYWVFDNIYPYLVNYDKHYDFIPSFARKWQVSSDGLTWTFHTVGGAKWSDGDKLDATDAAWTFSTLIKYRKGPTANFVNQIAHLTSAEAPDPETLVLHYDAPVANVLSQLVQIPILPPQVWSRYATGDGKDLKSFQNVPTDGKPLVSGGPFMLTKYQKDQLALLQRNPEWWGPKPQISGWGMQIFNTKDAMITAFRNGQLDEIGDVPFTATDVLEKAGFVVERAPGDMLYDFIINSNPKKPNHRELLEPGVRKAFEYATDRKRIVDVALDGNGTPGTTIVPPATGKWHDSSIKPLPFSIDKANRLLDRLGFKKGSDGIREADGHPMSYQVIVSSDSTDAQTPAFRIMESDFKKIGVQLQEKVLDPNGAFSAITEPDNKYLNFDLSMWNWVPEQDPDFILSVMTCNQWGTWSDTGYCKKSYDKLYDEQGRALNLKKRVALVHKAQKMVYDDRPYIVLNYPDMIDAHTKKWTGFYNMPGSGIFINILSSLHVHTTS